MLMKKRAPVLGGSFALWGGLFSSCECTLIHLRNKEDFLNPIVSGFSASIFQQSCVADPYFANLTGSKRLYPSRPDQTYVSKQFTFLRVD